MPDDKRPAPNPRTFRRWVGRLARWCVWTILLLAVFHRPIVHHGGRWLLIWLAKREHVALDLRIEGNLWSHIALRDIRATGGAAAPIERLTLDFVSVEYRLISLVRGDFSGVRSAEIGKFDAVITPQPPHNAIRDDRPRRPVADVVRKLLAAPFPSTRLTVGRADVLVRDGARNTRVRGFSIHDGMLGWERVEIPGVPPLERSSGRLTLDSERISLTDLPLLPEAKLVSLELKRASGGTTGGIFCNMTLADGLLEFQASPDAKTDEFHARLRMDHVAAEKIAARFGVKSGAMVRVKSATGECSVVPEDRESFRADLRVEIDGRMPGKGPGVQANGAIKVAGGFLDVEKLKLVAAGAEFEAGGRIDIGGFSKQPGTLPKDGAFKLRIDAPDMGLAGKEFGIPVAGKLVGDGVVTVADGIASLALTLHAAGARFGEVSISNADAKINIRKAMAERAPMAGLSADASVSSGLVTAGPVTIDRAMADARLRDLRVEVAQVLVEGGRNKIAATGSVKLSASGALETAPEAQFKIDAPAIEEFGFAVNGAKLRGRLAGEGSLAGGAAAQPADLRGLRGVMKFDGGTFSLGDASVGGFRAALDVADGAVAIQQIAVELGDGNTVGLGGRVSLLPPHEYSGSLALDFKNLASFRPLLSALGVKQGIGGAVKIDWNGKGDIAGHNGVATLGATGIRVDDFSVAEARLAAAYTPDKIEVNDLLIVADKLRATGHLAWAEKRVSLSRLDVRLDGQPVLTGDLSAPLNPMAKPPLAMDQPISAALTGDKLDIGKLFASFGKSPPITGVLTTKVTAAGTVAKPVVAIDFNGKGLRPGVPVKGETATLGATDFDLAVSFENDLLKIGGAIRQPELKPIAVSASAPLALEPLLNGQKLDLSRIPLKASVEMPASELNFVPRLVPALAALDGTATVAVRAGGTLAGPRFDGAIGMKVNTLRMANPSVPPVSKFEARIGFSGDTVTIEKFAGEAGGGTFSMGGRVNLAKLEAPVFDLGFVMKQMLLMRDDAILVRADSDLTLRGPMSSAAVAGSVFVTQSRFAKDVDILPLSLPGKPKPVPRSVSQPATTTISFPNPPLRDWKFDVAVKTRADDPFRVRGNLARGEVSLDVRLEGTGLEPYLTGAATVEKFRATLPVSTLTTRRGLVTFSREAPFVPRLEIEAESAIRRHTVVARVSGPATQPRLDLESEPALEQGEILSLLTTGSLTGEVGSNNAAMATRAAILVVKGWYKKIFKRDLPASSDDGGNSVLDRFEVELGNVDQRTGQQAVSAQFRVTDDLFFLGDLELGGGFTGRVKYLIRFK